MYTPAVTIVAAWISALTGVGPPYVERNLRRLAGRADEKQEAGCGGCGAAKQSSVLAKLDEVQRPDAVRTERGDDGEDPEQKARVTNSVDDKCLAAVIGVLGIRVPKCD